MAIPLAAIVKPVLYLVGAYIVRVIGFAYCTSRCTIGVTSGKNGRRNVAHIIFFTKCRAHLSYFSQIYVAYMIKSTMGGRANQKLGAGTSSTGDFV